MISRGKYGLREFDRFVHVKSGEFRSRSFRKILDLGSGLGRHTQLLRSEGFDAFGLDIANGAIEKSREKYPESASHIMRGDMRSLPFKAASFDAVLAWRVLYLDMSENIDRAIGEVRRITRQGGGLYASIRSTNNTIFHLGRKSGTEIEKNTFIFPDGPLKGTTYHFFDKEEVVSRLQGYEITELFEDELEHTPYTAEHPGLKNMFWMVYAFKK